MNVLLINQYYPPDTAPTGLMLERVAEALAKLGHEVTILSARGGYATSIKRDVCGPENGEFLYRIVRIRTSGYGRKTFLGKLIDYGGFYLGVAWYLAFIRPKPDRIVALTTPPFLSVLARLFSKIRGADHAHWVMDLYPDVMVAHGMISKKGITDRVLGILSRWGFGGARCRMVLTLGPDMEERTSAYLRGNCARDWVPLWGTAEDPHTSVSGESGAFDPDRKVVLMYSGNMGLGHRFHEFLQAATTCGDGFVWKFHGLGKRRGEIESFLESHPDASLTLGDYVPREDLAHHLASADVHLASLEDSWDGTMVPSKLQGIFAMGKPVIFVGSATCSIGQWILESDGGWVVPPNDEQAMQRALAETRDPRIRRCKGQNALHYSRKNFDAQINALKVAEALTIR